MPLLTIYRFKQQFKLPASTGPCATRRTTIFGNRCGVSLQDACNCFLVAAFFVPLKWSRSYLSVYAPSQSQQAQTVEKGRCLCATHTCSCSFDRVDWPTRSGNCQRVPYLASPQDISWRHFSAVQFPWLDRFKPCRLYRVPLN